MEEKFNLFKTMTGVLDKNKNETISNINKIPSYMFCKWLSGNPKTIFDANFINLHYNMPIEAQYKLIRQTHLGKVKYIQWVKNEKDDSKEIETVAKHLKFSFQKAKEFISLADKDEINSILEIYKGN